MSRLQICSFANDLHFCSLTLSATPQVIGDFLEMVTDKTKFNIFLFGGGVFEDGVYRTFL